MGFNSAFKELKFGTFQGCAVQIYERAETKENSCIYPIYKKQFSWNFTNCLLFIATFLWACTSTPSDQFYMHFSGRDHGDFFQEKKILYNIIPHRCDECWSLCKLICVEKVSILSPLLKHLNNSLNTRFWVTLSCVTCLNDSIVLNLFCNKWPPKWFRMPELPYLCDKFGDDFKHSNWRNFLS